jgi:2-polyprenyl-6-methoxyphenol hydroxylase-like FAD-dependent oxidoreductase
MPHAVVVGAGPAGAALSYLLARRGIDVTLLERHTDFAREFRGEGLMPSGVAAFGEMGLGAALDALPQTRITGVDLFRGAHRLLHITLDDLGGVGPRVVSQPAMLELLVAEAGRFPSFRLERGTTVRDLVRDHTGRVVGVRVDASTGSREVRGDIVIGTDGRASVLRVRAGLHEERFPQAFDIVWCKVPIPAFLDDGTARAYLGDRHFALAFPAYDARLQIAWVIDKGSFGDLRRRGIDGWLAEMAAEVSPDLAAHLRAVRDAVTHPFLLDVVCDRLVRWTAPGLLLLGDAAHPMSPVGGQGINLALRDALVAANHLCPALAGGAVPAEVDAAAARIVEERLPEVTEIQELQQVPPRVLFGHPWWNGFLLRVALPVLVRTGIAARVAGSVFRRFAYGVTTVRLEA